MLNLIIHDVLLARDVLCLKWMNKARAVRGSILNLAFGKQSAIILLPKDVAGWLRGASGNVSEVCSLATPFKSAAFSALVIN